MQKSLCKSLQMQLQRTFSQLPEQINIVFHLVLINIPEKYHLVGGDVLQTELL